MLCLQVILTSVHRTYSFTFAVQVALTRRYEMNLAASTVDCIAKATALVVTSVLFNSSAK